MLIQPLVAGAAVCFATAALAHSPCTDLVPPLKYRHEPTVPYRVIEVPRAELDRACAPITVKLACTFVEDGTWVIYRLTNIQPARRLACLMVHEKAHINGWPADHPGALSLPEPGINP